MNVLIGVIPHNNRSESLLVLEQGECSLRPFKQGETRQRYKNYDILKNRPLKIADHTVSGPGVFRFRYGPVTSGVREAGSYDLYTYGEKIIRTGIDLSWKCRNIETAIQGLSPQEALPWAEYACHNFAMAHSVAYCRAVEMALDIHPNLKTNIWRQLLLEAERIYNHLYVTYKLMSAASQKVPAAHLHALFEKALRLNKLLTGSRFLLGFNQIQSVQGLPEVSHIEKAIEGYRDIQHRFEEIYRHSLDNANYLDRLHGSGTLSGDQATALGLTGPTLRACGLNDGLNETKKQLIGLPVITQNEGDALARMESRSEELVNSCQYLADHLKVSDTWNGDGASTGPSWHQKEDGEGCGVGHAASGALGYYVEIKQGKIQQLRICTPSYSGMHAIATVLNEHIFTDFPFVVDSFGVYFADAAC